jgi:hypothetical protein
MLKHAGRGHDPSGAEGTQEGECSTPCRCCPIPHANMDPTTRRYALPHSFFLNSQSMIRMIRRWVDSKFIAMDANFRQKAQIRPNDAKDKALGPGWATFVNYEPYAQHLASQTTQDEVSSSLRLRSLELTL